MKYDSYFATQYKDCFVFFGIPTGTSEAKVDGQLCTISGCVATFVEVEKIDEYIWSAMPELSLQLTRKPGFANTEIAESVRLCGGFVYGEEIRAIVRYLPYSMKTTNCWSTSLKKPFSCWSESTPPITSSSQLIVPPIELLVAVQRCNQYIIYCYLPKKASRVVLDIRKEKKLPDNALIVTDEEKNQSCLFSTDSVTFDRHASCAVVGADLFVVSGNKMARVEKFSHFLVASANTDKFTKFSISFDLEIPHANGTIFVVRNTLCVVGGCDDNYEPFSDVYQFDLNAKTWNECGSSSVSRYGASVVPFIDRKGKDAVFIAGGFKGKDVACSIIEVLAVDVKS